MIQRSTRFRFGLCALLSAVLLAACDDPTGGTDALPAQLAVTSGDLQQAPVATQLTAPLVVRLLDEDGQPVAGQMVNFRVTAGGGQLAAGAATTDARGEATDRWTLGTVAGDTQRVEVAVAGLPAGAAPITATFRAVGTAGPPAAFTPVSAPSPSGLPGLPLGDSVAVQLRDAHGNAVAGHTVAWQVTAGGGSVSPATSVTNAAGVAKTQWTLGSGGEQRLQAAASTGMTTTFVATAQQAAGPAITIVSGQGQAVAAGSAVPQPLVVEVRQNGVPVAGVPVVWTVASPDMGTVTPSSPVTDAAGRVQAGWTLGTAPGGKVVTASAAGIGSVVFNAAALPPTPPAAVIKVSGDHQTAPPGTHLPEPLVVEVRQNGLPLRGAVVTWSAAAGMGFLTNQSSFTDANGRAQTTWRLGDTPGGKVVSASVGNGSTFLGTVTFSAVAQGSARVLTVVSGDGQTVAAGSAGQPLVVEVRENGVPVSGVAVLWTPGPGAGRADPVSGVTDASGRAQATWTLGPNPGAQALTVTASGAGAVGFSATATPPAGRVVIKVSGDGQTAPLGSALPAEPVVEVRQNGVPVQGAEVTWIASGDGWAGTPRTQTDAQGRTSTRWNLGRSAGMQTLTVHVAGAEPVTFSATATALGGAAQILKVSGDGQTTYSGYPGPSPMWVRVVDAQGQGVPNVVVRWTGAWNQGSTTDAAGYTASMPLGRQTFGTQSATATLEGLPPVEFSITTVPGPPGRLLAWNDTIRVPLGATNFDLQYVTLFDVDGVGSRYGFDRTSTSWRLLDNTGAVSIVFSGNLSRGLQGLAPGQDRLEISRGSAADTVQVVVSGGSLR